MTATDVPLCPQCAHELPKGAGFCPTCGAATPATLSGAGGLGYESPRPDAEQQQRRELQEALGPQYELRVLLGRGGFAEVYEAWDTSLKRTVAVKTLRKDLAPSSEMFERFRLEAEAIAKLRHPYVIPIYAVGGNQRRAFFVMPKVDGESLADALRRETRIPIPDSCRILREAAEALAAAHRAGILHRDVKPENIMLDGPDRRVLMMDFGIAKSVEVGAKELTGTGTVVGTPHYMSPEQASGERALDSRSDQYSLAVVAYRMLSGELPFDGDSLQSVIMKQITAPARPVGELAPDVPTALATVIDRALAKKPADRYASLEDFAGALRDVERDLDHESAGRERITIFKERVELMRSRLPGWRHPLAITAILAFFAAGSVKSRTFVPYAYERVGERDAAQFAAQDLLAKRGVSGPFNSRAEFGSDSLAYQFLQPVIGRDSAERVAAAYGGLWHWTTTFRRKADGTFWSVSVGEDATVHAWARLLADSARIPNVSAASAESLAVAELRLWGLDPAQMRRRGDSTTTRANRTDRLLRWVQPDGQVVTAVNDTAWFETRVRVSGDRVTGFWRGELVIPPRFGQRLHSPTMEIVGVFTVMLIGFVFLGVLIWLVAGPMRRDPPNWRLSASVAIALAALSVPDLAANVLFPQLLVRTPSAQAAGVQVMVMMFLLVLLAAAGLIAYVSAGFLSARSTSADFAAIGELTRGELRVPELASAAAIGGIAGSLLALGQAALPVLVPESMIGTTGGELPGILSAAFPATDMLGYLGVWPIAVLFLAAGQSLVMRWTKSAVVAVALPILVLLLLEFTSPAGGAIERITPIISITTVSLVTWRFGVLSGAFTLLLGTDGGSLIGHAAHPSGANVISGGLALVVLLMPFALAVAAHRRVNIATAAHVRD